MLPHYLDLEGFGVDFSKNKKKKNSLFSKDE